MKVASFVYRNIGGVSLLFLSLMGCRQQSPSIQPLERHLEALPQDPMIQVYFNHTETSHYQEPYRQQTRGGDNLEQVMMDSIASAKSSVEVAVQELRLPNLAQVLVEKYQSGVKVRVILENIYNHPWSELTTAQRQQLPPREQERYQEYRYFADSNKDGELSQVEIEQGDALLRLRGAGVPLLDDTADGSLGSGLMHHKFVIVDGHKVLVTSANFTYSDIHGDGASGESRGNPNNLLKIESPALAGQFLVEFNQMWGDGPKGQLNSQFGVKKLFRPVQRFKVGQTEVALQFSPTAAKLPWADSVNGLIDQTLKTGTTSIDLALFVFSDQQLANTLQQRHQKRVQIRSLIDRSFAYRFYSEGLDLMGVTLAENCEIEANNQPWKTPLSTMGVPNLPAGDRLHHKFAVIDGKTVITGSHNWSEAANRQNDETLLVLSNPVIAAHFTREFERLYRDATLGVPAPVQAKLEAQAQQCGTLTEAKESPTPQSSSAVVNLNTASQAELETLPGVGPKLAQQIIFTRRQQPFTSLEDVSRVPGIGEKTLEKFRDRVTW